MVPQDDAALEAQIAARTAERDEKAAELARTAPAYADVQQRVAAARRKVAEVQTKITAVRNERRHAEERFNRQVGTRAQGVEEARTHLRAALSDLGRSAITDTASYGEDFEAGRQELAALAQSAETRAKEVKLHEAAIGTYEPKKVFLGIGLVVGGAALLIFLLLFPFIYEAIVTPSPATPVSPVTTAASAS